MESGIFISYRRDDTRHVAGRLATELAARFGAEHIFRDVDSIEDGENFATELDKALTHCTVMLVLIGPAWLSSSNAAGQRRLDIPSDWVRLEVAGALKRNVRVVPLLVENAELPAEADLAEELRPLVQRQARKLSDERWRGDFMMLTDMLAKQPGLAAVAPAVTTTAPPPTPAPSSRKPVVMGVAALLVVAAGVAVWSQFAKPKLPDLSGTWRTNTDFNYSFNQNGAEFTIKTVQQNKTVGTGNGRLVDGSLRLVFTTDEGKGPVTENCDLKVNKGADGIKLEGTCQPTGTDADGKEPAKYDYTMFR